MYAPFWCVTECFDLFDIPKLYAVSSVNESFEEAHTVSPAKNQPDNFSYFGFVVKLGNFRKKI